MTMLDRFRLDGQVALVTGGSKGIGLAIAQAFADAGASLVLAARDPAGLAAARAQLEARQATVLTVPCDVSDEAALQGLLDATIDRFGQLDILVNNAGGAWPNALVKTPTAQFEKDFHFNVGAAFALSRMAVPHLQARRGNILNITSAAARYSQKGFTSYGTAKAALTQLTKLMAAELAPAIRVNAIAPGTILTEALGQFLKGDAAAKMIGLTPMQAMGKPEDIAAAALYLASPAAQWVTGKVLEVDGGAEASTWPF